MVSEDWTPEAWDVLDCILAVGFLTRSCCKTSFKVLSGHGFNRAEQVPPRLRLQPLRATDAPQGLKPLLILRTYGTTKVVP